MIRREVILFKEEVTYNTDPTPTAGANAVLVRGLSITPFEQARIHTREDVAKNTLGPVKPVYGGHLVAVTFQVELAGSGTAGTAPRWGDMIEAAGCDETIVASTSVAYEAVSSGIKSGTMWAYRDGKLRKITGCRATAASFDVSDAGLPLLSLTFLGHDAGITDTAIVTPTLDGQNPVPFIGASSLSVGAYAADVLSLTFDFGLSGGVLPDVTASDGFGEVTITAPRRPTGTLVVPQVLKATHDWEADVTAGNELAFATGVIGSTAGNRWQIDFPVMVITNVTDGEVNGILTHNLKFTCVESSGDDDFKITLT